MDCPPALVRPALAEDPALVFLTKQQYVIEAFPAKASDEAFALGVTVQ